MQTPSTKVTAATVAATVSYILVWAVQAFTDWNIPAGFEAGVVAVLTLVFAYVIPETNPSESETVYREQTPPPPVP